MLVFAGVRALPGDPALALGGENREPAALAAIRDEVRPRPAAAGAVRAAGSARAARRPRRRLSASCRSGTRSSRACRSRSSSPFLALLVAIADRGPRRDLRGGAARHGVRLPGRRGRARRPLGAALLARADADPDLLGRAALAAGVGGFVAVRRRTRSTTCATCCCRRSCSAPGFAAVLMRQTRAAMLDSLSADYVRTARREGPAERRGHRRARAAQQPDHGRHDPRPAARAPDLRRGVTEQIFVLPGFGKLTLDAVFRATTRSSRAWSCSRRSATCSSTSRVDLLYSLLNPRIRVAGAGS